MSMNPVCTEINNQVSKVYQSVFKSKRNQCYSISQ